MFQFLERRRNLLQVTGAHCGSRKLANCVSTGRRVNYDNIPTEIHVVAVWVYWTPLMKIYCGGFNGLSVCVGSLSRPLVYASRRIKPAGWFTTFLRQKWFTRLQRVRVHTIRNYDLRHNQARTDWEKSRLHASTSGFNERPEGLQARLILTRNFD